MISIAGYQFNKSCKSWLGAFLITAASISGENTALARHYELLDLGQIEERAQAALAAGNTSDAMDYQTAATAIQETQEGLRATPYDMPADFSDNLYDVTDEGTFKVIDPARDVDWTDFFLAQKTAQVKAERVGAGTEVVTLVQGEDGTLLHEATKTAGPDGGYVVTNPTGEQYLVDVKKFESVYEGTGVEGVFAPIPDPRKVVPVEQNVSFEAPWGGAMRIQSGGVLVHGGVHDIYGINPKEYQETYSPLKMG